MIKTKGKGQSENAMPDYILGYGSLIEFASRTSTAPNSLYVRPARANGLVRGWFAQATGPGFSPTYLGAVRPTQMRQPPKEAPFLNGVLYYVSKDALAATDKREDAGYKRVPVATKDLVMLDGSGEVPKGNVWIYLNEFKKGKFAEDYAPSATYPIVQSYVDVCVNGSMEIESNFPSATGFTKDFIESTAFWSSYWVNDRPMPRRPFIYRANSSAIDAALSQYVGSFFAQQRIEPASWEGGPQV